MTKQLKKPQLEQVTLKQFLSDPKVLACIAIVLSVILTAISFVIYSYVGTQNISFFITVSSFEQKSDTETILWYEQGENAITVPHEMAEDIWIGDYLLITAKVRPISNDTVQILNIEKR